MTKSLQRPRTRPVASGSASDKHQNTHTLQHTAEGRTESAVLSGAFHTLLLFEQFQTSLPHFRASNGVVTSHKQGVVAEFQRSIRIPSSLCARRL